MFSFRMPMVPSRVPEAAEALPDRSTPIIVAERHAVLGTAMRPPWQGMEEVLFGMGCFWGAERKFWQQAGVHSTQVGYAGGRTAHASYKDVCSGRTGHTEVVRVVYAPQLISFDALLRVFWENHDPTQGMRQGNDIGTQYRSAIYCDDAAQLVRATATRDLYQKELNRTGWGQITTEITGAQPFFYAEDHHQQYLHKNPDGYCGIGGTGISCPVGVGQG